MPVNKIRVLVAEDDEVNAKAARTDVGTARLLRRHCN